MKEKQFKKYYTCFDCKDIIQCIPGNFENTMKVKDFLIKHTRHSIALLDRNQLKEFSNKRFREFNCKIQRGVIQFAQDC